MMSFIGKLGMYGNIPIVYCGFRDHDNISETTKIRGLW